MPKQARRQPHPQQAPKDRGHSEREEHPRGEVVNRDTGAGGAPQGGQKGGHEGDQEGIRR